MDYYGPRATRGRTDPGGPIRQLPPPARDFTGRGTAITTIEALLDEVPRPVVNIYGLPGTGKTTLAVEVAARLGPNYTDCQLYFDLARDDVEACLGRALVWLGVQPSELVPGVAARAED